MKTRTSSPSARERTSWYIEPWEDSSVIHKSPRDPKASMVVVKAL